LFYTLGNYNNCFKHITLQQPAVIRINPIITKINPVSQSLFTHSSSSILICEMFYIYRSFDKNNKKHSIE
jgi:hypothetical protein